MFFLKLLFPGSHESAQGLGTGLGSPPKPDNAPQQRRAERLAAGRRLRVRHVLGGRQPGPENGQAGGKQAEGALRTDAGDLHFRHQHHGGQGPETLRVSHLQETAEDGPEVRGFDRFRDGQQPETLDAEGRGPVVRHKITTPRGAHGWNQWWFCRGGGPGLLGSQLGPEFKRGSRSVAWGGSNPRFSQCLNGCKIT